MSSDTILICHSGLGTEKTVSQRIQTNMHKIGKNGAAMEVAAMYKQMKEWWYNTMIMQDACMLFVPEIVSKAK